VRLDLKTWIWRKRLGMQTCLKKVKENNGLRWYPSMLSARLTWGTTFVLLTYIVLYIEYSCLYYNAESSWTAGTMTFLLNYSFNHHCLIPNKATCYIKMELLRNVSLGKLCEYCTEYLHKLRWLQHRRQCNLMGPLLHIHSLTKISYGA
jgi:hypothetical protein